MSCNSFSLTIEYICSCYCLLSIVLFWMFAIANVRFSRFESQNLVYFAINVAHYIGSIIPYWNRITKYIFNSLKVINLVSCRGIFRNSERKHFFYLASYPAGVCVYVWWKISVRVCTVCNERSDTAKSMNYSIPT